MVLPAMPRSDDGAEGRLKTNLLGRYMLADRREFPCAIVDVAGDHLTISGPEHGALGETVIVYIDQLGRVEGKIARHLDGGFAVKLHGGRRATEKLTRRVGELQGNARSPPPERRREPRIKPDNQGPDKQAGAAAQVVNLSLFGAEIKIDERPPIGALVQIGRLRGRVVRHSKSGVAIEFVDKKDDATLTERLTEIELPKVR